MDCSTLEPRPLAASAPAARLNFVNKKRLPSLRKNRNKSGDVGALFKVAPLISAPFFNTNFVAGWNDESDPMAVTARHASNSDSDFNADACASAVSAQKS